MDSAVFEKFCQIAYENSGIKLGEGKESLVSARVAKRLRATGISDEREYLRYLTEDRTGREMVQFIDAISTNLTSFFRESVHFDFLRRVLEEWQAKGQLRYRVWCAAASTGEEPYTIAMTMLDTLGENRAEMKILATDISTRVLQKCLDGVYDERRVETVPAALKQRYLERVTVDGETCYAAAKALRSIIFFKRLNLAAPPFPMHGPMDVVFCRNVMIYFDTETRGRLVSEIYRVLKPGGYLILGLSENLTALGTKFKSIQPAVYQK